MTKVKQSMTVFFIALLFSVVSFPAHSSCDTPFTGEFILCDSQVDQFWNEVESNCEGKIIGPVSITIISCDEEEE